MNGCMIDLNKPCVSELEIIDIAVEFLLEGRPNGGLPWPSPQRVRRRRR